MNTGTAAATTITTAAAAASQTVELENFLVFAAAVSRCLGYMTNAAARDAGKDGTATLAWIWASKGRAHKDIENLKIEGDDRATAKLVMKWMDELKVTGRSSEWSQKISFVAKRGNLFQSEAGIVASALPAWKKESGAGVKKQGVHLGVVGQNLFVPVKLIRVGHFSGKFGDGCIYNMQDAEGNVIQWFTNKTPVELCVGEGSEFTISGSVKEHGEYNGVRQTVITRAKVIGKR